MYFADELVGTFVPITIFLQNEDPVTISSTLRHCLRAVALSALCAAPLHAATINLSTASATYNVGQSFNVDFRIGGLTGGANDSLSGFDLDVLFDSGLLKLTGYG